MLSSCSNGSLSQEMSVYSMWTDTIQMSYAVTAHRKRVGIMQQRMETLSLEDSNAQCERRYLGMAAFGLRSSYLKLERSFLKLARHWLQGHFCVPLLVSEPTPIGDIDPSPLRTSTLVDYRLIQQRTQSLMLGYHRLWRDLELVSVVRLRRAEYILCPSFYDAMLRLVTRSLRRADASMFTC